MIIVCSNRVGAHTIYDASAQAEICRQRLEKSGARRFFCLGRAAGAPCTDFSFSLESYVSQGFQCVQLS
jgi:hypothetical protein